jgi:signal transduction histidine kinase
LETKGNTEISQPGFLEDPQPQPDEANVKQVFVLSNGSKVEFSGSDELAGRFSNFVGKFEIADGQLVKGGKNFITIDMASLNADDKDLAERRFSSDAAHELRTPIAEIKSLSELIVKWPEESTIERQTEILRTAKHMETVLESLMNLAQWDSDSEPLQIETIVVNSVIRDNLDRQDDKVKAKNLVITCHVEDQTVEADPTLFQLIVSNLLSNAIEHTPAGGTIDVSTGKGPRDILQLSNTVADFNPDEIQHFTERFWRADGVRTGDTHCGLGLSIVSACVERLQWKLTIEFDKESDLLSFHLST